MVNLRNASVQLSMFAKYVFRMPNDCQMSLSSERLGIPQTRLKSGAGEKGKYLASMPPRLEPIHRQNNRRVDIHKP